MAFAFPTYRHPALVTYGTGSVKSLASSIDQQTVVFMSGSPPVADYLRRAWAKSGPQLDDLTVFTKPVGEPTWRSVQDTATSLTDVQVNRIVAIGGGAVLDWARLVWAASVGAVNAAGLEAGDWTEARQRVSMVLVPTTCGSGAEAASVAVYLLDGRKVPVVSPILLADHVVLDSKFLATVSEFTLACSLADALSHALEAWMSIVPGRLPREAALSCFRLILREEPHHERTARLMDAGFLGGVAAAHCSVGVVHAFAHSMARHGLGHGHANALALRPALRRLIELPAAVALTRELGVGARELDAQIERLTAPAVCDASSRHAVAVLSSRADRRALMEAMVADPCMRTCPASFSLPDLEALLDDVRDGVTQRC